MNSAFCNTQLEQLQQIQLKEKFYSPTAVPFECLSSVWTHKHKIPLIIYIAKGTVKQIKLCHLNNSELICQLHNLSDEAGILEKGRI